MPTYEYRCNDCSVEFERFQSITADPIKDCPECPGTVKRLIGSGGGLIFKGSGFYQTDYRKPGYESKRSAAESKKTDGASPSGDGGCGKDACKSGGCASESAAA